MVEAGGVRHGAFHVPHIIHAPTQPPGHLFIGGSPSQLCRELVGGACRLPYLLSHVHRDADGAGLVGHGPAESLPDPPRCIRGEPKAPVWVEPLNRLHQSYVALLDEVLEGKTVSTILLGYRDDQPEVLLYQLSAGSLVSGTRAPGEGYLLPVSQEPAPPDHRHVACDELWSFR